MEPSVADIRQHALAAAARGWPVHPLAEGGKTPLTKRGFKDATTSAEQIEQWWQWWPDANYGIRTGADSALYVVDGDAPGALLDPLGEVDTFTVETPHDGLHAYLRWERGLGNTSRMLGPAVDTRGEGGYVVGPGSVLLPGQHDCKRGPGCTGGEYVIIRDVPPVAVPVGVLGRLRERDAERDHVTGAVDWATLAEQVGTPRARGYADSGIREVLAELGSAREGTRNETSYALACRLLELGNLGGYALDSVKREYLTIVTGVLEQTELQARGAWRRAEQRVGHRPAIMPPEPFVAGIALPPSFSPPAAGEGIGYHLPMATAGLPSASVAAAPDGREVAILQRVYALEIDAEARRRMLPAPTAIRLLTEAELGVAVAQPEPLVQGWLWRGTVARLWGESGTAKTFAAVGLAASISTGRPWHTMKVRQGLVVYLAAEDPAGVELRLRAWCRAHDIERTGVLVIARPLVLLRPAAALIAAAIMAHAAGREVAMIVVDTQARVTEGLDENSGQDMSEFAAAVGQLSTDTGAAVLVVHHTGVDTTRARGHTSVKAAFDTEIRVTKGPRGVQLTNPKQKNRADGGTMTLTLRPVDMGERDSFGDPITSCVLDGVEASSALSGGSTYLDLTSGELKALPPGQRGDAHVRSVVDLLRDLAGDGNGVTVAQLRSAWVANRSGEERANTLTVQFTRAFARLEGLDRIGKTVGQRVVFREFDGLDDLDQAPDASPLDGYGLPSAVKSQQRKRKK